MQLEKNRGKGIYFLVHTFCKASSIRQGHPCIDGIARNQIFERDTSGATDIFEFNTICYSWGKSLLVIIILLNN